MKCKSFNRALAVLLSLMLIVCFFPTTVFAANSTGIKVNGVDIVNAPNYTVECGDGTAVYDPSDNVLTLENATITRTDTTIPISFYGGDLTILLKGSNTITTPDGGIVGYRGNVIFKSEGNGSLTINSSGLFGVYCDDNAETSGHITVDGATLNINTTSDDAQGLHALRSVTIKNNANVTLTGAGTNYFCIYAEEDLSIADSTLNATLNSADGGNTVVSYGNISIERSTVNVTTRANNIALAAINGLSISDNSQVTVKSNGNASAVYTPQNLTVSDSILKAESSQIAIRNGGAMHIVNSTVEATCKGDPVTDSLHSEDTISIEGNSDVLVKGKISAVNGVSIVPSSETFIDVKVGMKENGEEGTSLFEGSPYKEPTTLSGLSAYTYVHILKHTHTYDQDDVSDAYKASAATCMAPAEYYYSCVCGKAGTSTFTSGTATGHTAGTAWESDENVHWNECVNCGDKMNEAAHTFEWVTDKEATATEAGSKHEECTVCGYVGTTETIAATGTTDDTDVPQTGDNSNLALWIAVMFAAGAALTGTAVYSRKRKYSK